MEEKKTKKKPKLIYILIFTLALVLLLTGLFDMKAHAEEYPYSVHLYLERVNYNEDEEDNRYNTVDKNFTSESPIYLYLYNILEPITGDFSVTAYAISQSPINGVTNPTKEFIDSEGVTWYCVWDLSVGGKVHSPYSSTFQWFQTGADEVHYFNRAYEYDEFVQSFTDDTLDLYIDYDSFEKNNEIPILENVVVNRYSNWVSSSLYNQYFDYITWSSNTEYEIQFEKLCSVYFTRKSSGKYVLLGCEYNGEFTDQHILDIGTNSFTNQTDMQYVKDNCPDDWNFYENIRKTTDIENWDRSEIVYIYRARYVDSISGQAGRWTYIYPTGNYGDLDQELSTIYETMEDDSYSDSLVVNGSTGSFTDIDDYGGTDYAEDSLDELNDFKEQYETIDNEADIQEVSNWLKTVVNFISGTPSVVSSVLGFLPHPILYGLYIIIFLGIIASGFAIIKALF